MRALLGARPLHRLEQRSGCTMSLLADLTLYKDAVHALLGAQPLHRLEQSLGFSMSLFAGPGAVRGRRARAARCAAAAPA